MDDEYSRGILYQLADTVLELKALDPEELHRNEVFKCSMIYVDSFFDQLNKKIDACESDYDIGFVKETALNFFIFSLKKIITGLDCPDENIVLLANQIREQLLSAKREGQE